MSLTSLNESPSEKEGKFRIELMLMRGNPSASMKVPPKRKGNHSEVTRERVNVHASMKVPPKRKGNRQSVGRDPPRYWPQ